MPALPLVDDSGLPGDALDGLVAIHDALEALSAVDPALSELVELRFFGGMTHDEIARYLGTSLTTVERRWRLARAWLYRHLTSAPGMTARADEVARLFALARAADPDERSAVLDRACGDLELRREVESLLAADEQAGWFLEVPVAPPSDATGAGAGRIGPYRLVRLLGEGEVSTVHLAERDDDAYHQRVAIKLIQPPRVACGRSPGRYALRAPWQSTSSRRRTSR